jgi:maltokinase
VIGERTALTGLLARWLPAQRWCPGTAVTELTVLSDVLLLDGEPELRHLIVAAEQGGAQARYQLLIGLREHASASLGPAAIGEIDGRTAYDALHDPQLAAVLLAGIAAGEEVGGLRFIAEPGASLDGMGPATSNPGGLASGGPSAGWTAAGGLGAGLAGSGGPGGGWPPSRVMTVEQSNTSVVFGEAAILKVVRRLFPGANPDLEVASALAGLGSTRVAAPYGWIETELDGEPVLLGVLSQFLAQSADGWSLAGQELTRLLAGEPAGLDFVAAARLLGQATAEIHADLATAFGSQQATGAELAALTRRMTTQLGQAVAAVPDLAPHAGKLRDCFAGLADSAAPVRLQRIHGDYHLGQVLRTPAGWVALDFEGEPAAPLAERRALAPALRDVAGMLRSFDYAARHQLLGREDAAALGSLAGQWSADCQAAFRAGYAAAGGDAGGGDLLLRALTLDKAVYEVLYESRLRPAWLPIPLGYIEAA